jgi:hypothetical protein
MNKDMMKAGSQICFSILSAVIWIRRQAVQSASNQNLEIARFVCYFVFFSLILAIIGCPFGYPPPQPSFTVVLL